MSPVATAMFNAWPSSVVLCSGQSHICSLVNTQLKVVAGHDWSCAYGALGTAITASLQSCMLPPADNAAIHASIYTSSRNAHRNTAVPLCALKLDCKMAPWTNVRSAHMSGRFWMLSFSLHWHSRKMAWCTSSASACVMAGVHIGVIARALTSWISSDRWCPGSRCSHHWCGTCGSPANTWWEWDYTWFRQH